MTRSLTDIAEDLRKGLDRQRKCTLLVGAGCSKTAGIPLAADIVRDIKALFPRVYERALTRAQKRTESTMFPSYGDCMAELDPGPQRDLIRGYIDKARLNWAHVGIGSLVANGYVDRLLTTNFDPLIAQGCAVFNEFPAVYDLTMSATLRFEDLPDKAVFHLHGQRNGFSLLNDPQELAQHRDVVEPLFRHAREGRTWIVVGYSGENDPLFELIQQSKRYDYALYWIGREKEAPLHVQKFMGDADVTRCHYLQFAGADEFFVQLSHALGHFPPPFMNDPLGHMAGLLDRFTDFPIAATESGLDLLGEAKSRIESYRSQLGALAPKSTEQVVVEALAAEGSDRASELQYAAKRSGEAPSSRVAAIVAFAEGNRLYDSADAGSMDSIQKLSAAAAAYERAVNARPDMHEALYNWGFVLTKLARLSEGNDADALWQQALEKYDAALKIKPDMHQALISWGGALDLMARRSEGDTARALLQQAILKYEAALKVKPDEPEAFNNWGHALFQLARCSENGDARSLWQQAFEKYDAALKIKPDMHTALGNWGLTLDHLAQRSEGLEARALWRQAIGKYEAALQIKPDEPGALNQLASTLLHLANVVSVPSERATLLTRAYERAVQAYRVDSKSGAYNAACAQAQRGDLTSMVEWLDRATASGDSPGREHVSKDTDFDAVRDTREFKAWLTKMGWD